MLNVDLFVDEDKNQIERYDVVDGQQRLTTLFDYIEGASWAAAKKGRAISPYKSLTAAQQHRFDEYNVPVALMRDFEEDELLDSFSRLQNAKPLKIGERIKALPTKFHPFIRELTDHKLFRLAGNIHKFRDAHWNLAAIFLKSTYKRSPLDRQEYADLEHFLKSTRIDLVKAKKAMEDAKKLINFEAKVFEECLAQSAGFEATLRTARPIKWLFVVLSFLLAKYSLSGREHLVATGLLSYYAEKDREGTPEWAAYMSTGRTGRIDTGDVRLCLEQIVSHILIAADPEPLDPARNFTAEQRKEIFEKSGGKCAECKVDLSPTNFHADHIKAHRAGGRTEVANGQALCSKCNLNKGGSFKGLEV